MTAQLTRAAPRMREWELFRDWCIAAGQPFMPATAEAVAMFLEEVPAAQSTRIKRLREIRRAHRDTGYPLALPVKGPQKPWRTGRGWLSLDDTLNRIPLEGWLDGFAGRRDAFLAVLIGACGLSRAQARAVGIADVVQNGTDWSIGGRPVPRTPEPGPCPACAVARWLGVLKIWDDWGRFSVRGAVTGYRRSADHDCLEPSEHRSILVPALLPAIDRHGWLDDWEPMSVRSISAVLAYRQDAARFPEDPVEPVKATAERPDFQRTSMQGLEELLDELDDKVAAALARSEAVMAGSLLPAP